MDRINQIAQRVIQFYAQNPPISEQIIHTQSVANFTQIISNNDELQIIAAWLHDIGCPISRKKHGDSRPPHQEAEGKLLVHQWFDNNPIFTPEETDWLANAVGGHHRLTQAQRYNFQPLYEADLIVNLFEGYYAPHLAQKFVNSGAVTTPTGKTLFKTLFNVTIP